MESLQALILIQLAMLAMVIGALFTMGLTKKRMVSRVNRSTDSLRRSQRNPFTTK